MSMSRFVSIAILLCCSLSACQSSDVTGGIGGLAFEATAAVVPPPAQNVQVTAKITNISTAPIDVQYGGCYVMPVFHTGSLDGPIVYDPRPSTDCTLELHSKTLDPDASLTLQGGAAPSPALAAGKYYVEAVIKVNGETTSVGAGAVTF